MIKMSARCVCGDAVEATGTVADSVINGFWRHHAGPDHGPMLDVPVKADEELVNLTLLAALYHLDSEMAEATATAVLDALAGGGLAVMVVPQALAVDEPVAPALAARIAEAVNEFRVAFEPDLLSGERSDG